MLLMLGRIVAGSRIRQTLPLTASLATVRHRKIADLPPRYDDGRGDRIRTCDPLVPNQMRYQAAPLPDMSPAATATNTQAHSRAGVIRNADLRPIFGG